MASRGWQLTMLLLVIVQIAHQAPLDPKAAEEKAPEPAQPNGQEGDADEALGLEYEQYLREVIEVLEADPEMKSKMDEMTTDDLLNGKFGKQLNNVGNHIRTQLDDLKRKEIQRLRVIARKMMEKSAVKGGGMPDQKSLDNLIGHLDPTSMDSFSADDITKLIQKATKDLEENDKERRKEFKRYEMEKELRRRSEMKHLTETERLEAEKKYDEEREKLKLHSKVNHPGSKKQLEEVWEKTDHLDRKDFDPKTFFFLHDSNGDGFLDEFELEALFIKEAAKIHGRDPDQEALREEEVARMREHVMDEVEKVYQGQRNVDPQEKFEELARMREHVVNQIDANQDKMVSLREFMEAAAANEFDEDSAWQDLNQEDQFTEDDLNAYQEDLRRTLEDTKARMAEAGDNFVRVRQPQRQQPVAMDQAKVQQIKDDLTKGLPQDDNKLKFVQQPPVQQPAGGVSEQQRQPQPPGQQPVEQVQPQAPGIQQPQAPGEQQQQQEQQPPQQEQQPPQ